MNWQAAIEAKSARMEELARDIDLGLWTGRYSNTETAYAALQSLVGRLERWRRVLAVRYGR